MTENKPKTQIEDVRQILAQLEQIISHLSNCTSAETLEIPALFDQAFNSFEKLNQSGAKTESEKGLFETLCSQFRKKLPLFIQRSGGAGAVEKFRKSHSPERDRWWWYADQIVAQDRKNRILHWARNLGVTAVLVIIAVVVYQKFLAPDPAITASMGHQSQADRLLSDGNLEDAYQEVQNALMYRPDQLDLLIMKGVIEELLERPEDATESFQVAKMQANSEDVFYNQRSSYYIMAGLPELGIEDCNTALQINPDSVMAYLNLGQAYQALGDLMASYENFELADQTAQRIDNAQLQAIARVQMSQVLQQLSMATPVPLETQE